MDVNRFYKELFEYTLGLDVLGLESQFPEFVKLVEEKTIPTFGQYLPVKYKIYMDLTDEKNIIRKDHQTLGVEYYLSDPVLEKYHLPILDVLQINYNNLSDVDPYDPESAAYYSSVIASRNNLSLEGVLMGAEYSYNRLLTDFAMPWKKFYELRGSHVLYLRNFTFEGTVEIIVKTLYPNLVAIPEEYRNVMMDLAKYDIKIKCWNELKYLPSIVTPVGNIDLKIDDWENAERERDDYLKDLRTRSFPDRVMDHYFRLV